MTLNIGTSTVATIKDPKFTLEDLEATFEKFDRIPKIQKLSIEPIHIRAEVEEFAVFNELAVYVAFSGIPILFSSPGFIQRELGCQALYIGGRIYVDEMARYWLYCQVKRHGGTIRRRKI